MKNKFKKVLSCLLPLVLALVFVAGTFEVGEMLGAPGVASYVLGSDGDYTPPSPSPAPAPAKKKGKKANTLTVSGKTVEIPITKISKKTQTIKRKTALSVSKAKGKVTYKKKSGNKKITINKAGKITVKKGLKIGTYKLKVKVTAAGTSKYKKKTVTKTVTIKIVKAANPMAITTADVNVAGADLENDAMTIPVNSVVTVKSAQGAVIYEPVAAPDGIEFEGDNMILSKGLAPGSYTVQIGVTATGNSKYAEATKVVQFTVNVN